MWLVIIVEDCNVIVTEYLVEIVLWLVTSDMRTTVVGHKLAYYVMVITVCGA